jgi:hypothetical protein
MRNVNHGALRPDLVYASWYSRANTETGGFEPGCFSGLFRLYRRKGGGQDPVRNAPQFEIALVLPPRVETAA